MVAPGTAARDADLVHLRDHFSGAPHERDLLPGLARDHRDSEAKCSSISVTMRLNTSSPFADTVDHDQLAEALVEVDDRDGLLLVELEATTDGFFGVVGALDDRAAALVARPVHRRAEGSRGRWCRSSRTRAARRCGRARHRWGRRRRSRGRAVGRRARARAPRPAPACAGSRRARSRRRAARPRRSGRRPPGSRSRRVPARRGRGSPRPRDRPADPAATAARNRSPVERWTTP